MTRKRKRRTDESRKAVAYVRTSTSEQRLGPEAQRDVIGVWCEREGFELVGTHEDQGISSGGELEDWPGLLRVVDDLREHGAGVFAVTERYRLARDVGNAAMSERLVAPACGEIGYVDGNVPEAMLTRRLLDLFAARERALITSRTKGALATENRRGERIGGIPYSYGLHRDRVRRMSNKRENEVVKLVKVQCSEGAMLTAIAQ